MPKYQTLSEFLFKPFGKGSPQDKINEYEASYAKYKNSIKLNAHTKIEDAYYFHVKIPSESQKDGNVYYDVVIRFFTDSAVSLMSTHLRDYYIQFFSNSPGFIYNYAVLYKNAGYLITDLYAKLDPRYFDKLPEHTNANLDLSFDKSIYFACKFLNTQKFKVLNKFGIPLGKKLPPDKFFKEIKDFQTVKMEASILALEKKSLNKLEKNLEERKSSNRDTDSHIKHASTSTSNSKPIKIRKKTAGMSTTGIIKSITKKTASKTTRRK